jgi:hypothetical protein
MITREEALEKACFHLDETEQSLGDVNIGKHLSLAQLYLSYAHEMSLPTPEKA